MRIVSTLPLAILLVSALMIGVCIAEWNLEPSMGTARHGLDAIDYQGKIYAIGGWNGGTVLEVFEDGVWSTLAPLPSAQQGVAAARVNDKIYTFGNYGWQDITQIYDIPTDTWSTGPSIPVGLYWSTAETVGHNVYLIAGNIGTSSKILFILNTLDNTWTTGDSLPQGIQIPASAAYNNQLYAFGNNNCYFKYDIATDSWTNFTGPPSGHGSAAEAVTVGDKIYLLGGSPGNIYQAYDDCEIYDPATDTWTDTDHLNVARYQFGSVYMNGLLYAVGGRDATATSINTVESLAITPVPVSVYLTPVSPPVLIPASGASFDFIVTIDNLTTSSWPLDFWSMAVLPDGSEFGPLMGPLSGNIGAGVTYTSLPKTQAVPGNAPAGLYYYKAYVGSYPNAAWTSDLFPLEKAGNMDGAGMEGWFCNADDLLDDLNPATEASANRSALQIHPNPFNPVTTLSYTLPQASKVTLSVYDINGRLVTELVDGWREAGVHDVTFDATGLASGVYLYHLNTGEQNLTGKMLFVK